MTEEEKLLTAYHEGGHAIVALNVIATDPIHKATTIPRGRALGMVMQLPEHDKLSMSLEQMTSRLAIMMGGRVAEELVFGREKVTSGAASDIEQATRLARMMVTRWGLSEHLGAVSYGENQDEVFLGMSVSRTQNISEATVQKIDSEIRRLVEQGYKQATRILTEKRADLETLAKGLLESETLSGEEIEELLQGTPPARRRMGASKACKVREHTACEQGLQGHEPAAVLPRAMDSQVSYGAPSRALFRPQLLLNPKAPARQSNWRPLSPPSSVTGPHQPGK
jgi:cell division protease FtsH